ncbi:MAG: sigma-70 family RNA polymerase sigma factor, partial [Deltaproteobacteria bacterium]|nr:sigma-70 family RNA polymerase sigma factor [Deltaproteobacteria bacterium]
TPAPLSPVQFAAYMGARLPNGDDPLHSLTQLHGPDLFLAASCAAGNAMALAQFEERFDVEVRTALARYRDKVVEEDFRQALREKLFVTASERPPGISQYAGRGELRYWVKMTIVRALTDWMRRRNVRRREVTMSEQTIDVLLAPTTDPEIEYLKSMYRAEFRSALAETLEQLETRERNLLRYSVADGLSIDEIGVIYRVHRSTAARWLNKARDTLIDGVSERLRRRLAVEPAEFQSILRLIQSRVDVNVAQMLE